MAAGEDLVGLDYAQLTAQRFAAIPILPATGRFFPLAFQEYNVLDLIARSASAYYLFAAVELVCLIAIAFRLLAGLPTAPRIAAILWLLLLPGVAACFQSLVIPERDVLICLGAFLMWHRQATRTRGRWPAIGALIAAEYALYLKETAFILIGAFAAAHLAISWFESRGDAAARRSAFIREHWLDTAVLALCAVFLAMYATVVLPHVRGAYGANHNGLIETAAAYFGGDVTLACLAVTMSVRFIRRARRAAPLDPFWDAAALAALLSVLGYVKLGLDRDYYAAPAELIATLYVARHAHRALSDAWSSARWHGRGARVAAAVVVGGVALLNARIVARRLVDRKRFVADTQAVVNALRPRLTATAPRTLFFPQYGGFEIMEFGAYLSFKGIRVSGLARDPAVILATPHRFPDDRCYVTQPIRCETIPAARAEDLVVLLPGREAPPEFQRALVGASSNVRRPLSVVGRLLGSVAAPEDEPSTLSSGAVLGDVSSFARAR